MSSSDWPTQSAEALANFVEGRDFLRSYIFSGRGEDLEHARSNFSEAEQSDPEFTLATYYVAVADSELRDSDAAIGRLKSLARRQVDFLPETYLQLAYAHTRKYQDRHYFEAEEALNRASEYAKSRHRQNLVPLIEACRTFLYSVMGGRLEHGDRGAYLDKAIALGTGLLVDTTVTDLPAYDHDQVLFQVHNALGIAFMRKGQSEEAFSVGQSDYWERANKHYAAALDIRPGASRTLQNIGTLLRAEGDQFFRAGDMERARAKWLAALEVYRRSLDVNSRDQFPHYRVSELAARLGDWDIATKFYASGMKEKGGVKAENWERLSRAILRNNATELLFRD
jgi:tetratricopeptide (TPR) repeat protein